jgi:hypothetical protein
MVLLAYKHQQQQQQHQDAQEHLQNDRIFDIQVINKYQFKINKKLVLSFCFWFLLLCVCVCFLLIYFVFLNQPII